MITDTPSAPSHSVIHRRADCRGCGSRSLDLVLRLEPTPIGDAYVSADRRHELQPSYPIDLFMCQSCGLAQLTDVIDPEVLYGDYLYVTQSSLGLSRHFGEYAEHVIARLQLTAGALVIDIGSNDGTLLRHFQQRRMRVLGVEPASHIAAQAQTNGVQTIDCFFTPALATEIVAAHGTASLATANNVFANIDDLGSWVDGIDRLLAPEGVFVFESFYLTDLVQNMVFDFIYHEHLSAFSVKPVQALFGRVGLELVAVEPVATKGGSLRYFIQRAGGPMDRDGSVERFLALEDEAGLYEKSTFAAFTARINELKDRTRSFLADAKAAGKTVAGFGASITVTTLLYHFGIGEYVDYLVDDNPAKQNRFSPGLHLPVFPSTELDARQPDYVVALAWRYAAPFIAKHQAYIDRGGRFVIPVPEFTVVEND